jgi:outer membrane protein assembly factor BamB
MSVRGNGMHRWRAIAVSIALVGPSAAPAAQVAMAPSARPGVLWSVAGEGRGTPAVHGTSVYFLSKRHEVLAVDRSSGRVKWRRHTGEAGESTAGSVLLATARGVVAGDDNVIAFDHDGARRWRFAPEVGHASGIYLGSAGVGLIFAGSASGHLFAIDDGSGRAHWTSRLMDDGLTTVFPPVVEAGAVFAGFSSFGPRPAAGIAAFEAATGRPLWRRVFPGAAEPGRRTGLAGGPIVADQVVVAASRDGAIHAFDRASGADRWRIASDVGHDGAALAYDHRALARAGRTFIAGSLSGTVLAYDLDTRRERWRRAPIDASVSAGIAADATAVYVPYLSGQLVALGAADGAERWRTEPGRYGFHWPPLPAGDRVYVSGSEVGFFALSSVASAPRSGGEWW